MVRVLWQPLAPRVEHLLVNLPGAFRAKPLQTGLITASLFPFSLIIIAVLPAVLIVDYMVQELYDAYGAPLEVLYEDGLEMARIGLRAAMLSSKESIRTTKQLARKARENPLGSVYGIVKGFVYTATHPVYISQQALKLIIPATSSFMEAFKLAWWLKTPARGTHE